MLTDRTAVMRSVRTRSPLPRTSRTIGKFDKVTLAAGIVIEPATQVPGAAAALGRDRRRAAKY
jgi:hypothetical protein